jgi:hypothetical protein
MGSCHQSSPLRAAIIDPSQVLPVRAAPKIHTRFSGRIQPALSVFEPLLRHPLSPRSFLAARRRARRNTAFAPRKADGRKKVSSPTPFMKVNVLGNWGLATQRLRRSRFVVTSSEPTNKAELRILIPSFFAGSTRPYLIGSYVGAQPSG